MRNRPAVRWWVYLLWCRDGSLYTGITNRLEARIDAHNRGKGARYTRSRRPVRLAHAERAKDKGAALRREAEVKRWSRKDKLALVKRAKPKRRRQPTRVT